VIDLRAARQEPERFRAALARRGAEAEFDALLEADRAWRAQTERVESLRAQQKRSSKGAPTPEEIEALKRLKTELGEAEQELAAAEQRRNQPVPSGPPSGIDS
jgi:seryl-tRNA synthetase